MATTKKNKEPQMTAEEKSSLFWGLFIGLGGFVVLFIASC